MFVPLQTAPAGVDNKKGPLTASHSETSGPSGRPRQSFLSTMPLRTPKSIILILSAFVLFSTSALATAPQHRRHRRHVARAASVAEGHSPYRHASVLRRRRIFQETWTSPTFADSTAGDLIDGEDLNVRRAAVQALGPYNGTVVVADPSSGRILTIVNQKLAFQSGFQPCSTIKLVAALAGLSEGIINKEDNGRLGRRWSLSLTEAIAHSNNYYFATVGERLGFERIEKYAKELGLGEKAGLDIPTEEAGTLPPTPPDEGLGMMTSFGSGIYLTPLQLTALVSAIANGGTLYWLQYPRSTDEVAHFEPKVKRALEDVSKFIPEIRPGMEGAVEHGTARRAAYDPSVTIMGKTGTCTDTRSPTHLGWFGSFNQVGDRKLVVTVLLTGGRPISGPVASGIAGRVYKNLADENYFGPNTPAAAVALLSTQSCCQAGR